MLKIQKYCYLGFSAAQILFLQDADQAITKLNLWNWLKEYSPDIENGYLFDLHPNIEKINTEMKLYYSHTSESYTWTLRQMKYIAVNGYIKYMLLHYK